MVKMVTVYEAKAHLSKLIAEVQNTGQPITVCRHRKPIVDIVAHAGSGNPLEQDAALQGARFNADPCSPVDPADWPEAFR